jgi:hypothetical protein
LNDALFQEQVNIDLIRGKKHLECSPLGVIDGCAALDWIEECSTFGGLVAFGSIVVDSMLTAMNVKKFGWFPYTCAWDVDEMVLNDPS